MGCGRAVTSGKGGGRVGVSKLFQSAFELGLR